MRPDSPLLRSEVSARACNSLASQPCSSVSGKSFIFIIVWNLGGKPVSVLGFCSPIRPAAGPDGPLLEVSQPSSRQGRRALPVVGALYLLDSRLSVSQRAPRMLSLQIVLLGFSYN